MTILDPIVSSFSILYFGDLTNGSNSLYRARALQRIGHDVTCVDTKEFQSSGSSLISSFHFHSGYIFKQRSNSKILELMTSKWKPNYDFIWIDSGAWCGPSILRSLRKRSSCVVLWNNDDPFGPREPMSWLSLSRATKFYDFVATVREVSANDFRRLGVKNVGVFPMGFDEVEHCPERAASVPECEFRSEVVFVGTYMEDRDDFLVDLIKKDVPLSIWGNRYERSKRWRYLKPFYRGGGIRGAEYVAAIQRSNVSLGFVSKTNRDDYTRRSAEIPFCGGLLCGKRTNVHLKMYRDNEEAVFWNDSSECAHVCHQLLKSPQLSCEIRRKGMSRIRELDLSNESVCKNVLQQAIR